MMKRDWTGEVFGKITVIKDAGKRDYKGHAFWECRCDCKPGVSKIMVKAIKSLKNDNVQSCGCSRREPPKDLTGQRFGSLTVVDRDYTRKYNSGHLFWNCVCDCTNTISIAAHHLTYDTVTDCGCTKKETKLANMQRRWQSMIDRCYNPEDKNYHLYGGRGIRVHKTWRLSFDDFYKDMGDPPYKQSLGRIDNDGDYSPDNCRWETEKQQANNRSKCHYITIDGVKKTISQWSDEYGDYIKQRISSGWDDVTAVSAPYGLSRVGAKMNYEEIEF